MFRRSKAPTLEDKRKAYEVVFGGPLGQIVLNDLADFCRADSSTFDPDPRVHAFVEGRREVWLRINEFLNLTPAELADIRRGRMREVMETDSE